MSEYVPTDQARRIAERGQLSDEAAAHVREAIVSGRIAPGTRVLAEAVAQELGVSTTPAREGLLALRAEGFLSLEPRKGFVVAPLTGRDLRDAFNAMALLCGEEAAHVAEAATADDLEPMRAAHAALERAAASQADMEAEYLSQLFYRELHALADMPKIAGVVIILARHAPHGFFASVPGWSTEVAALLGTILDRLEAHDPAGARAATEAHLRRAGEVLEQFFDSRP